LATIIAPERGHSINRQLSPAHLHPPTQEATAARPPQ